MSKPNYIEPAESEAKYRALSKLGKELGIPVVEAFLELEVLDKNGKTVEHIKHRSHSWNRNAYNWLLSQLGAVNISDSTFGAGLLSMKNTAGTIKYGAMPIGQFTSASMLTQGYIGTSGSTSFGIVFGSSTGAESFEDFALTTLIANGTGAGQLSYVVGQPYAASYNAGSKTWTITHARYANNNSGGSISVNEIGLSCNFSFSSNEYCMVSRDHLASTITVPDSGQIKATYTLSLVYPN